VIRLLYLSVVTLQGVLMIRPSWFLEQSIITGGVNKYQIKFDLSDNDNNIYEYE